MMTRYRRRYRRRAHSPIRISPWAIVGAVVVLGLLTWWRLGVTVKAALSHLWAA